MMKSFLLLFILLLCTGCQKDDQSSQNKNKEKSDTSEIVYDNYNNPPALHKDFIMDERILKIKDQIILDDVMSFDLKIKGYKDSVYILNIHKILTGEFKDGDSIPLYIYSKGKMATGYVLFPKVQDPRDVCINDFIVTDKHILILSLKYLYVYDKSTFNLIKKVNFEKSWLCISKVNGKLFLYRDLFGLPASCQKPEACILAPDSYKVIDSVEFEIPKGGNMTYSGPKRLFGVWSKGYFISDASYYRIKFYDFNKKLTSEIKYLPALWIQNKKTIKMIDEYKDFDLFRNNIKVLEGNSFIECIDFVNDSTFLLQRSDSSRVHYYFDIWQISNNKWELLYSNIKTLEEKDKIIGNNYISGWWNNYGFLSDNLYWMMSSTPFNMINDDKMKKITYGELRKRNNEYYLDNPQRMSIHIYDFVGVNK